MHNHLPTVREWFCLEHMFVWTFLKQATFPPPYPIFPIHPLVPLLHQSFSLPETDNPLILPSFFPSLPSFKWMTTVYFTRRATWCWGLVTFHWGVPGWSRNSTFLYSECQRVGGSPGGEPICYTTFLSSGKEMLKH